PSGETVALRPTYQASAPLPRLKQQAVTNAPTQTSRQAIFASGMTLKISANKSVLTASPTSALSSSQSVAQGSQCSKCVVTVVSAALTTSETSSKKATPITIVNEKKRSRSSPRTPRPGRCLTFQIWFSAICSSPNTPEAPNNSTAMPTTDPTRPALGACALSTSASIARPACSPTTPASCWLSSPRAASSPKKTPATAMETTISGAIESSVYRASDAASRDAWSSSHCTNVSLIRAQICFAV